MSRLVPPQFESIVPPDERYIFHCKSRLVGKSYNWYLCITDLAIHKIASEDFSVSTRKDFTEVHSVEADPDDNRRLRFVLYILPTTKAKVKLPEWGIGEVASVLLRERDYEFDTEDDRDDMLNVLRRMLITNWQRYWEVNSGLDMPPDEVYQYSILCTKRNRKGKLQIRYIVLSTKKFYNVEAKLSARSDGILDIGKLKWGFPIADLTNIIIYEQHPVALSLTINTQSSVGKQVKNDTTFIMHSASDKDNLANELKRLYQVQTNSPLKVITEHRKRKVK